MISCHYNRHPDSVCFDIGSDDHLKILPCSFKTLCVHNFGTYSYDAIVEITRRFSTVATLQVVDCDYKRLPPESADGIVLLLKSFALKKLSLHCNCLGDKSCVIFEALQDHTTKSSKSLKSLDIGKNRITDSKSWLALFDMMANNKSLVSLDVSGNYWSAEFAPLFANLIEKNNRLTLLVFDNASFPDKFYTPAVCNALRNDLMLLHCDVFHYLLGPRNATFRFCYVIRRLRVFANVFYPMALPIYVLLEIFDWREFVEQQIQPFAEHSSFVRLHHYKKVVTLEGIRKTQSKIKFS